MVGISMHVLKRYPMEKMEHQLGQLYAASNSIIGC